MADSEIDINSVVAHLINQRLDSVVSALASKSGLAEMQMRRDIKAALQSYLVTETKRIEKMPTLVSKEPVSLYDYYVPITLQQTTNRTPIDAAGALALTSNSRYGLIIGTGGSGKSVLLRHLFLDAVRKDVAVPVLLEFRKLVHNGVSITEGIAHALGLDNSKLDWATRILESGSIILLLDGFDEVPPVLRAGYREEIDLISRNASSLKIYMTSRPGDEFRSLVLFTQFNMVGLTRERSVALVHKLDVPKDLKTKFINSLKKGKFDKHSSFLSNPMLLTIMFMTFWANANIPTKNHLFYRAAYDALWNRHDAASKSSWERVKECGLDIDDFGKILEALSVLTLSRGETTFDQETAYKRVRKALRLSGLDVDVSSYLRDAVEAVCVLIRDGEYYEFQHRTFQEYFAARYIVSVDPDTRQHIMTTYFNFPTNSILWPLIKEIDKELFESEILLPRLELFLDGYDDPDRLSDGDVIDLVFSSTGNLRIGKDRNETGVEGHINVLWFVNANSFTDLVHFMHSEYFTEEISTSRERERVSVFLSDWLISRNGNDRIDRENIAAEADKLIIALSTTVFSSDMVRRYVLLKNNLRTSAANIRKKFELFETE